MKSQISDLLDMIDELQGKLEAEFSKRRAELNVRLEKGKVVSNPRFASATGKCASGSGNSSPAQDQTYWWSHLLPIH